MTLTTPSSTPTPPTAPLLTPIEARVLGTLMEKARTVPDSYPLSLNSLLIGCNQKTTRDPIMELNEAQVATALDELNSAGLVRINSSGRTTRYEHNFQRGIGVFEQAAVLLGLLMLRGPQTAGELRLNSERWYKFADISSVDGFLEELQERSAAKGGPLVVKLARGPGTREQRWAHLLCGPVDATQTGAEHGSRSGDGSVTGNMAARIDRLEAEVAQLRATVQKLCSELGVSPPEQA
ncbi:YceH family protein [Rhodoferax ferrireducens]|uniref:YceH family protein n=1 Tax=Rhodoferax ferrireducens TaxID=192843 RepID=UPI000E0CCBB8|nr:YceH family protein [Rhodoferax ferrireducens]